MKTHWTVAFLACAIAPALTACSDGPLAVPPGSELVVGNDNQSGAAGQSLPAPLSIRIVDPEGNGVSGVRVVWEASEGEIETPDERTDAEGYAEATWTLPTTAGVVRAEVRAGDLSHSFSATTLPAAPVILELARGAFDLERADTARVPVESEDTYGNTVGAELLEWSSSDDRIASVSADGIVTAHRRGVAVITATGGGIAADVQVTVPGTEWKSITAGSYYTCGITADAAASCWGENFAGQLGASSDAPLLATPQPVSGGHAYERIITGTGATCGLTAEGALWCWGTSYVGELGVPENAARFDTPTRVAEGLAFEEFVMGTAYACGRTVTGDVYCWGAAPHLEDPTHIPAKVDAGPFTAIAAGRYHACGIDTEGIAWCWGEGAHGELGRGDTLSARLPAPVSGDRRFTSIAAGWRRTCAIDTQERAVCWGIGLFEERVLAPRVVTGTRSFVELAVGTYYVCGRTPENAAYCWGWSGSGALGSTFDIGTWLTAPTRVDGAEEFISITAAGDHTCGITMQDEAWCWGGNDYGEIGDGSPGIDRHAPVRVIDPAP